MKYLFSLAFQSRTEAERLLPLLKEAGYNGVEPTLLPNGFPSVERFREDADELRRMAERLGLAIPSMRGGPLFWTRFASSNEALREEALLLVDKAAETVKRMGGDVLLVVPGKWEPHQLYSEAYDNALSTSRRAADAAKRHGVTIGLENVENQLLASPLELRLFLAEIGRPEVRCYYDVGNTVTAKLGYPAQWIRELGREYICRIHVKDAGKEGPAVPLLAGDIDWRQVTSSVREIGYDGEWIGVELPLPAEAPLAFLREMRQALAHIWGDG